MLWRLLPTTSDTIRQTLPLHKAGMATMLNEELVQIITSLRTIASFRKTAAQLQAVTP